MTRDYSDFKVSFRLPEAELKALAQEAERRGISPHALAREFVVDRLSLQDLERAFLLLAQDVETLKTHSSRTEETVALIKQGLMAAFEVMFVQVAKFDKSESIRWLEQAFEPKE